MSHRLRAVLVALTSFAILATPAIASARHRHHRHSSHFVVSGGVVLSGGVYYVEEPPPPPPVYAPAPQCYDPCGAPPAVQTVYAPRQPRLGIGLRTSSLSFGEDDAMQAEGVGVIGRLRLGRMGQSELEIDLGRDRFEDGREDSRLGMALYMPLTHGQIAPYLLVGAGINGVERPGYEPMTQGYLEAGAGLAWKLSDRLTLAADLRWSGRRELREDGDEYHTQIVTPEAPPEKAVEGRLAGILYF